MPSSGYMEYLRYRNETPYQTKGYLLDEKMDLRDQHGEPRYPEKVESSDASATASAGGSSDSSSPYLKAAEASSKNPSKGAGSVVQGGLTGAAVGSAISPGWGTAIGAGAGSLAALLSAQAELDAEKKKVEQDIYKQLGISEQNALTGMSNAWSRIL